MIVIKFMILYYSRFILFESQKSEKSLHAFLLLKTPLKNKSCSLINNFGPPKMFKSKILRLDVQQVKAFMGLLRATN